jgi:ferritin-like metal-binding protein YciE
MATLTKTKKTTTKTSTPKTTAVKTVKAEKVPAKKDAAKDLADLFEDGLKDLYWAEKNLLKNMPKMHKNASSAELKKSLEDHMKETENQIKRIEDCFKELGKKPQAAVCDAMKGLLE